MSRVYVGIGTNVDKERNIRSCFSTLQQIFRNVVKSSVYQSAAVGFEGEDFYNMVVSLDTTLTPSNINHVFFEVEKKHGRKRGKNQFVSRELDLDQLLYDDLIIDEDGLCLPHKDLSKYSHTLQPMAEIAGDLVHPVVGKCFSELWRQLPHPAPIIRVPFVW